MKQKVVARGVGSGVRVDLQDHSRVQGVIIRIDEESFEFKPRKDPDVRTLRYDELKSVHRVGMSTGKKVIIGVAIFGGFIMGAMAIGAATGALM